MEWARMNASARLLASYVIPMVIMVALLIFLMRRLGGGMGGLGGFDTASRYAPAITAFLLIVVLVRFGFLAGLGFLFFYVIGAAFGTFQLIRRIAEGKAVYPWLWRIANWAIAFLLAGWLSGGFR